MTVPTDPNDPGTRNPALGDPYRDSTWNTITGMADTEDLLDKDDFDDFLIEPAPDTLGSSVDREAPESTD